MKTPAVPDFPDRFAPARRSAEPPDLLPGPPGSGHAPGQPLIHRKASCACGGSCSSCRTNDPKVSGPDDTAGQVMRSQAAAPQKDHGNEIADREFKTKLTGGGISELKLDATFTVTNTPCETLQIIQVFWGTPHNALGKEIPIGKYTFTKGKKEYDSFVDGGKNSPHVTLDGKPPSDPDKPYYLTPSEHFENVNYNFSDDSRTIEVYDTPGAVVHYDEAYFETAIVAVNYNETGTDKILKVFKWGWEDEGEDPVHGGGKRLNGKKTGIRLRNSFSSIAEKIIANDYPDYKYT